MAMGMIGHFVLVAILKLPSWKGSISRSSVFLFLVPSGKMQMEMPDLTLSTAVRMVFSPCLMSFLSRKRQWRFHPGGQERDFLHFFFGNVAGADRAAAVGEEDVKVASVITDIQDRGVLRYIFLSYYCDFGSCDPQDKSKYSLNDPKRADILGHRRKFADDPFYQ